MNVVSSARRGDIRRCLKVAWENRVALFGGEPSHELLAQTCAVSVRTVYRFFKRTPTTDSVSSSESVTLVSADGKKRTSTKGTRTRKEVLPAKAAESGDTVEPVVIEKAVPNLKKIGHVFESTATMFAEHAGKAPMFTVIDPETLPEISPYSGRTREQVKKGLDCYNVPIPKRIRDAFDETSLAIYDGIANHVKQAVDVLSDYGGKGESPDDTPERGDYVPLDDLLPQMDTVPMDAVGY